MARIFVADSLGQAGLDLLAVEHEVIIKTGLSEDDLILELADVKALLVRSQTQVTARVIEAAPNLEVIGRAGVGVDNIDLDAATQHGVIVVNAPLANTMSTAEHAFALMLAAARNIPQAHASLRGGAWDRNKYAGVELAGRTLGIVGLGRIGTEVAYRARAFEMRVLAFDPFVSKDRASQLGVELMDLDDLLAASDFVTLHTALHDGTRGMISTPQLERMKPTAVLINAARGALVDEQALYDAVDAGVIGGAAIDVFSAEPAVGNVLTTHDRIIVTPHLAASTAEAQTRAATQTAEQILDVLAGRSARFAVNAPLVDEETMAIIGPYLDCAELAATVAMQLAGGGVERVRIEYRGQIGNYETAPLRAAVIIGLLERVTSEKVTLVNADQMAQEHGIRIEEDSGPAVEPFANRVTVSALRNGGGETVSTTNSPTGPRIVGIGEYAIEVNTDSRYLLAIENLDRPGRIGRVATLLGSWGVNINAMSVSADQEGRALMILAISTARALTPAEITEVGQLEDIRSVRQIELS
ncbi:MAG: phosphoglycerate dehydrogenase [Chloroflexi bacterium]|nr:phosphoglycerate dehydrogenase [Chloroflexota bacterium]MDA1147708.1 phosphoglycerate dehydrogenase [Chloroflexota bacterium]